MAKKYEFQPDKPYSNWFNQLRLTKYQQKQVLKWSLYALLLILVSVVQDVILCRMRIWGATTELVPCCIFLICILEGSHNGSVFALAGAFFYLASGSSPGPQVLILIVLPAILLAILRQTYLQPGILSAMLCTLLAMAVYEVLVFGFCLLLGYTTLSRFISFMVSALLSPIAVPVLYLIAKPIGAIGGRSWKE